MPKLSEGVVVGLIADTHVHLPYVRGVLPRRAVEVFREANVSLIIHAGDVVDPSIIYELSRVAPVIVVWGNADPPELRRTLSTVEVVKVDGYRVGVTHVLGIPPLWNHPKVERLIEGLDLDVLVFGHTHKPLLKEYGDVLLVNPGSPVDPMPPFLVKPTVALLVLGKEGVEVYFVEV